MKTRKLGKTITVGIVGLAVAVAVAAAAPRQPVALPPVGATFASPYDAVWDATLKSVGAVKVLTADKAAGRIETEPYPFNYSVGPGVDGGTQVIWVSMRVTVGRAGEGSTTVQVEPLVHDSLLSGFTPGPTNNPWLDLFGRIRGNLGTRG